jgi:hypothetical protein
MPVCDKAGMSNMHPIMVLAFILLAAVAVAPVTYVASAPEALPLDDFTVAAGPVQGGELAIPKQDPDRVSLMQPPTAETVTIHDARWDGPPPSFAQLNPETLRAEPEPAAPSAPTFVDVDTQLYARDTARLRAAPSTAADVLTKLAADAPLRAVARSTDRAWWRVSLADGRIGYVHRSAVTQYRVVQTNPADGPASVVAVAPPQPRSARDSQDLLGYVDETVNWLADTASRGSAPTAIRTER